MEMELKLMKEREREIAKSGGFTQLFNDDRDPSIHIQQLKVKYANMRKKMEDEINSLNDKKREIVGINVSLKAKLDTLKKLELDVYNKLKDYEKSKINELNNEKENFEEKNNEKINIENEIQSDNIKLKAEIDNNEELDSKIKIDDEIGKLTQNDFNNDVQLIEDLVKIKGDELSECKDLPERYPSPGGELEGKRTDPGGGRSGCLRTEL